MSGDLTFRGEFSQKVDSKGRMSIPADFRRILELGDPNFPENPNPRLVLLYGEHLKNCLHVYTVAEMAKVAEGIQALPRGSVKRRYASRMILGKSWSTEVDRDGRIVLPKERREQIDLQGEAKMVAMGEFFEIWNPVTFEEMEAIEREEFAKEFEEDLDGLDPMAIIGMAGY